MTEELLLLLATLTTLSGAVLMSIPRRLDLPLGDRTGEAIFIPGMLIFGIGTWGWLGLLVGTFSWILDLGAALSLAAAVAGMLQRSRALRKRASRSDSFD